MDAEEIWEECVCDFLGDINIFSKSANGSLVVNELIKQTQAITKEQKAEPNQTRGSPDAEGKASRETYQYTKNDYERFGWAREAGIISFNNIKDLESKLKIKKSLKDFPQSHNGEAIVAVNNHPDSTLEVNNTLLYVVGSRTNPKITKVTKIDLYNETDIELIERNIYDSEQQSWTRTSDFMANLFETELVREYSPKDFPNYQEYKKQAKQRRSGFDGEKAHNDNQPIANRTGDASKNIQKYSRELDTEYLSAVNRGDMETAQRMVDEAAKNWGAISLNGNNPTTFYHGTNESFTEFKPEEMSSVEGSYFFAENREDAAAYGNNIYEVYLSGRKLADYDNQPSEFYRLRNKRNQVAWLKERDYDGWYADMDSDGWGELSVFSPEQIKSADPVTYDDDGNVIPLSERFNSEKKDIRYSRELDTLGNELTREQSEYFKNSKVRDDEGNLKVMYHGSSESFTVFDKNRRNASSWFGEGFYFTENQDEADFYGDNIIEAYLNVENPYIPTADKILEDGTVEFAPSFIDDLKNRFNEIKSIKNPTAAQITDVLQSKKYDGIIIGENVVIFESNQAKLTTNENPTSYPDIRYSREVESAEGDKLYTYDHLINKKDLPIIVLPEKLPLMQNGKVDKKDIITQGRINAKKQNNPNNTVTETYVRVDDIELDVLLSKNALEHGIPRSEETALAVMKIGDILKNSIAVNELNGSDERKTEMSYVLLGGCKDNSNLYVVRSVVSKMKNEVTSIDIYQLGAVKGKKIEPPTSTQGGTAVREVNSLISSGVLNISIADFLDYVKNIPIANEIFSEDVAKNLGITRTQGTLSPSVRYSRELDVIDYMNATSEFEEVDEMAFSNRALLANALLDTITSSEEYKLIRSYQEEIAGLDKSDRML